MLRKLLVAVGSTALGVALIQAAAVLNLAEVKDWDGAKQAVAAGALAIAVAAGRAAIAYLTAFVPSDAEHGVNIVGKFK